MSIVWEPDDRKPEDAPLLEAAIARASGGARVKLTLTADGWLVRALAPAALCGRGGDFSGRDLSRAVADVLEDHGHVVTLGRRTS